MQFLQDTELVAINGGGEIPCKFCPTGYLTVPDWVENIYNAVTHDPDDN